MDLLKEINIFVMGGVAMGYVVVGLFFLRFYTRTHDRLFAMFAAAFAILCVLRLVILVLEDPREHQYLYWLRFVAYLLILLAIIDKNLPHKDRK